MCIYLKPYFFLENQAFFQIFIYSMHTVQNIHLNSNGRNENK